MGLNNLQKNVEEEMKRKNDRLEEMTTLIEEKAAKIKELSAFIESQTGDKDGQITSLTEQLGELSAKLSFNATEQQSKDEQLASLRSDLEASAAQFTAQLDALRNEKQAEIAALNATIEGLKAASAQPVIASTESSPVADASSPDLEQAKAEHAKELKEMGSKLKKTTSERDLLIREYKATKDAKDKLESILAEAKSKL